jgi:hypothetical protein
MKVIGIDQLESYLRNQPANVLVASACIILRARFPQTLAKVVSAPSASSRSRGARWSAHRVEHPAAAAGRGPGGRCVSAQRPLLTATSSLLPSEALGLFISDTVSGLDRNGRDSVTTLLRRYRNSAVLARPPAAPRREAGQHPTPVLDRDLELVALEETRFSSQPFDLAANSPSRSSSRTALRSSVFRIIWVRACSWLPPGGGFKIIDPAKWRN